MISFASLFLGLVFGSVNVELVVAQNVCSVNLLLDGRQVATLQPPWTAPLDLGPDLSPHELVAVAFNAKGKEVGRTRQWLNRPHTFAEAHFVLEPGKGGTGRIACLTWTCLTSENPFAVAVTFDGKPLSVFDPRRIELPPHVPEQVHFLTAELTFEGGARTATEMMFGGTRKADAVAELTEVPVVVEGRKTLPAADGMDGWFADDGQPLRVAAVEEGPAEVVFVVCTAGWKALGTLAAARGVDVPLSVGDFGTVSTRSPEEALGKGRRYRLLIPVPETREQSKILVNLFPESADIEEGRGGVLTAAAHLRRPSVLGQQRVAEAAAVAALSAAARNRRRAVVLILEDRDEDESDLSAADLTLFLRRLRVPLFVWSVSKKPGPLAAAFGTPVDVSSRSKFGAAVKSLARYLDRQRIVWVEGTHLPQSIDLTAAATGIRLAD